MKIAMIGSGYVGIVSGVCLAAKAHDVTCVDTNSEVVRQINRGVPHVYERGLKELLGAVLAEGRFRTTTNLQQTVAEADVVIIAVGTPSRDGVINLASVLAVARGIGGVLRDRKRHLPVVVKSTVTPGTTDTLVRAEIERSSGGKAAAFGLGMNPEFLREGEAIQDFMEPDRIVLGHEDRRTLDVLESIYAPWRCDKLAVNCRTAELIKYANNVLLATQISTVNELANLAAAVGGIDIIDVVRGIQLDRRWNPLVGGQRVEPGILTYLVPGCGFGGSCFPKDVQALRAMGRERQLPMHMLDAVLAVNDNQPGQVLEILKLEAGDLSGKKCLLLGLAFKPGTDDARESASIKIARGLVSAGAYVTAHDPMAVTSFKQCLGMPGDRIRFIDDWIRELCEVEIIIVATRWPEYEKLSDVDLSGRILFDARAMFARSKPRNARYLSIGQRMPRVSGSAA